MSISITPIKPQERRVDASGYIQFEEHTYDLSVIGCMTGDIIKILPAATFAQQGPGVYVWKESTSASPYLIHSLQHKYQNHKPEHLDIWTNSEKTASSPTHPETSQPGQAHDRISRMLPFGVAGQRETKQARLHDSCTADIRIQHISLEKLHQVIDQITSLNITCSLNFSAQEGEK